MTDSRETLRKELVEAEARVATLRQMLKLADRLHSGKSSPEDRFYGVRPLEAMNRVLEEIGAPITIEQMNEILVSGGIAKGKRPNYHVVEVAVKVNVKNGNLLREGDLIGKPEWGRKAFKTPAKI